MAMTIVAARLEKEGKGGGGGGGVIIRERWRSAVQQEER